MQKSIFREEIQGKSHHSDLVVGETDEDKRYKVLDEAEGEGVPVGGGKV